jgi:hydrogenase maturation protease
MRTKSKPVLTAGENKLSEEKITLVLGVGNILLKDEGVGVHVIQELQRRTLPGRVRLVDAGTAGLDALLSAEPVDKLIVIDALRAGGKPGTIYQIRLRTEQKDELIRIFDRKGNSKISLHQIGLVEALSIAEKIQRAPGETVVIGIEPEEVSCGLELTKSVKRKMPEIINAVLEEIEDAVYE